jgi:hypothetical protein
MSGGKCPIADFDHREWYGWRSALANPPFGVTMPLPALRLIEARGKYETAKKLRGAIGQVFRFAVATGCAGSNPTGALKGALAPPLVQHGAAIIEPNAFGGLLRAMRPMTARRKRAPPSNYSP